MSYRWHCTCKFYLFLLLCSLYPYNGKAQKNITQNKTSLSRTNTTAPVPEIHIESEDIPDFSTNPPNSIFLKKDKLKDIVNNSPNPMDLFKNQMGISQYDAGRIASLPVINGMADDRVATFIDGMRINGDCPNHMNPAISYLNPHDVATAKIMAGITPVSMGGDSLAGSIDIQRKDPLFAEKNKKILIKGEASSFYHSNGSGVGTAGNITVANKHLSLRYNGSWSQSRNYHAGSGGGKVYSSAYKTFNHDVTLGYKKDNHLFSLTYGQSDTPYEGFPNQYMDMTNNRSIFVNGKYKGDFDWGTIEARGYWQRVTHAMNMLSNKGGHSATKGMPMNIDGRTAGYNVKATVFIDNHNTLRIGSSFDHSGLNDWWSPLQKNMMMGPHTYHNINNGHRDRLGNFAEWEAQWTPKVTTLLGFRNDLVMMNTGRISGYQGINGMNAEERKAIHNFNTANRGHTDTNFDVTAMARWTVNKSFTWEGGYARKSRSPNLYERYTWGTSPMAMRMIGWFGDGNGYIGNLNLKPEVGNTVSTTFDFHDPHQDIWEVKVQPFYTYIHHYINVNYLGSMRTRQNTTVSKLQFDNHNAQIYGINTAESYKLWNNKKYGQGILKGNINWVMGQDRTNHNSLYHMMPLNGTLSLNEYFGPWAGRIEANFVNTKNQVDPMRREPKTPGYVLFNIGGSYTWRMLRLDASIENIANKKYYLPLGGMSLGDLITTNELRALPGLGRSFNIALTASF